MANNPSDHALAKYENVILASKSPRRSEILYEHGVKALIMPGDVDESLPPGISFVDAVKMLSYKKALAAATRPDIEEVKGLSLIVAADTVVYKDEIMGKPKDAEDAFRMLSSLRASKHCVASGVTLIEIKDGAPRLDDVKSFVEITEIVCGDYSDEEINEYIATDEPFDKAGSYAIQGGFRKYISEFHGDYENVVGLPYSRMIAELAK